MRRGLAVAIVAGLAFASFPARAQEWLETRRGPIRILYRQGNGAEASSLARGIPPVLADIEKDLGLPLPGEIVVRILPPGDPGSEAPHWAVGYVRGGSREIVLRGDLIRTYPFGDLLSLFGHEMTHVLLNTLPAAGTIPRWFQEGVAVWESRRWSLSDAFALGSLVLIGRPTPLHSLSGSFPEDAAAARAAYAESFHFVGSLERDFGPGALRRIVAEMKAGAPFPEAFRRALGRSLHQQESDWLRRVNFTYRWIPALTSTGALWMLITAMVLLGRLARRRRDRDLLERWKQQGLE